MEKTAISDADINWDVTEPELVGSQQELSTHLIDLLAKLSPED